ncbi:MAG: hypothetical protein HFE50_03400, partial [Clostridia bacterium]|nr:hypothetical protein [Clostridia bacterium]
MKHKQFRQFFAVLVVMAQIFAIIPAVNAADTNFNFPLVYDAADIPSAEYELGTAIDKEVLNSYGINCDTTNTIWSVQKINSADSVNELSLRFSSRTFSSTQNSKNLMTLKFSEDTVHNPPVLDGDGYIFETEFSAVSRADGYTNLILHGENADGEERNIAEIRLNPKSTSSSTNRPATASAVDAFGNTVGNSKDIKLS